MEMNRRRFITTLSTLGVAGTFGSQTLFGAPSAMKRSKVPIRQTPFGNTLDQQIEELEADPLVQRFKKARKESRKDPHYPKYHFLAPENRIGDPNGLNYWNGRWHLFYQFRPLEEPNMAHWGHAVSEDLIHWEDLPVALYPDPGEKHVAQCFSGSALAESDRVLAIYHSTGKGNTVVSSSDPLLLNWKKILRERNRATIPSHPKQDAFGRPYRVWDPFLWKEAARYYSLSGIFIGKNGAENSHKRKAVWHLFSSPNLKDWDYAGNFVENDIFTEPGDDGSCSYFWPLGNKHLLIFFCHRNGSQHLLGAFDKEREKFVAESHQVYRVGPSSSAPDPENAGKIILIANKAGGKNIAGNLNGVFTLPRRLSLGEHDIVNVEPAGDLASLRGDKASVTGVTLQTGKEKLLDGIEGNSMEMEAVIQPGTSSMVEINLLRSPDGEEYTSLRFYRDGEPYNKHGGERWTASIDTSRSSLDPSVSHRFPSNLEFLRFDKEPLRLRIFVDMSMVEVFVNHQAALAERVYPARSDSKRVSVRANGNGVVVESLNAWQMKSIYER